MWANRHDEIAWVVRERFDRRRDDPSDCAAPTGMNGGDMPAWWVTDQHRDTVRGASCDTVACTPNDQPVPFEVGDHLGTLAGRDLVNGGSVHLSQLEESLRTEIDRAQEACSVFANGGLVVANVIAEVQCVVRCTAHASEACRKSVAETVPIQKGRMQRMHGELYTTTDLREPQLRARAGTLGT